MGFRYLWADRYCIPQDDDEEKRQQLQMMGRIYEKAHFTIIAAAGDGPDHGLPGVTTTMRPVQPSIKFGKCLLAPVPRPDWDVSVSRWVTRGWTYQEGILSTRRLVFTQHQVFFQCRKTQCLKTLSSSPSHAGKWFEVFLSVNDDESMDELRTCIAQYIQRNLARPEDAIDAFRGILQRYKEGENPVVELYGLPVYRSPRRSPNTLSDNFILAITLSWFVGSTKNIERRNEFPSWTWAGWKTGVYDLTLDVIKHSGGFNYRNALSDGLEGHLSSVQVEFKDGEVAQWAGAKEHICRKSESSQVQSLRISGWLLDLTVTANTHYEGFHIAGPDDFSPIRMGQNTQDNFTLSFQLDPAELLMFFEGDHWHTFTCLLLTSCVADESVWNPDRSGNKFVFLILKTLPEAGVFERLDCLDMESMQDFIQVDESAATIGSYLLRHETIVLR